MWKTQLSDYFSILENIIAWLMHSLRFTAFQSNTGSNSKHCWSSSKTSWQDTNLHPRNDHPIKKQVIFHKIQWWTCPEGSKIQAWYLRQAHFTVYGSLAWNCLPCDEIEAFKRNLKTHLSVRVVNESTLAIWIWKIIVTHPRMLSSQFVALYKPCKPNLT